jgi:hypothetical protein
MFLATTANRAILAYSVDGENTSVDLLLECEATEASGILEIGEDHVFASKRNIGFSKKRRSCALRLYFRRRDGLSEKAVAKLSLSAEKIGELGFYPDYGKKDMIPSRPASLEAFVFVDDQLFERISHALQSGGRTEAIYLYVEKKDILDFGWEPDGSRIVWKLDNPTEPSFVDVTRLEIRLSLFG